MARTATGTNQRRAAVVSWVYYGGLVLVLIAIWTGALAAILPGGVATRVGHNSEGLLLAVLVAAWIQFARPRLLGHSREWLTTAAVSGVLLVLGILLLLTQLPATIKTLNESLLAAACLVPYLQMKRPLPRPLVWGIVVTLVLLIGVGSGTAVVTDLAEALAVLVLVPIAFDVVDRSILQPGHRDAKWLRWSWYAALVALPIIFSILEYRVGLAAGGLADTIRFLVRVTEAPVCLLLVELYFTVGLAWFSRSTSRSNHG